MDLNKYVIGRLTLNQYVHQLNSEGASFHVHYWGVTPAHYGTTRHKHSFLEMCYVVDGQGLYIEGDATYPLQGNTIFLSRPEVLHQIQSAEGLSIVYVAFELVENESNAYWKYIVEELRHCSNIIMKAEGDTAVTLLWKALLMEAAEKEKSLLDKVLPQLASSLLLLLLQSFVPHSSSDKETTLPETSSALLRQAQLYIKDNLSNDLSLTNVADHLHISTRHLSRLFTMELEISFAKYVQSERVRQAAMLLKTTNWSIKDISLETGFKSVHYFTRVFSSVLRYSPARFRSFYTNSMQTTYVDSEE